MTKPVSTTGFVVGNKDGPRLSVEVTDDSAIAILRNLKFSDKQMMIALGNLQAARVKIRTIRGQAPKGGRFKEYSTMPLSLAVDGSSTRGVIPKGGRLKKGSAGKTRYYVHGYRQFKRATTGKRKVNYTLSGRMLAATKVTQVDGDFVRISVSTKEEARIGVELQKRDPWLMFGRGDGKAIAAEARKHQRRLREIAKRLATRSGRGKGSAGGLKKPGFGGGVSLGFKKSSVFSGGGFGRFRGVHGVR